MFKDSDNEQFFRLFENIDVLFCLIGPDLYFKFVNKHWETVLGWSTDELKSKPFVEFLHEDDVQRTMELAAEITGNGLEVESFVNRYKTKDGQYKWLEWFSITTHDGFFPSVAKDISQIKAKNIQLQKAESRTQDLIENVPGVLLQYSQTRNGDEIYEYISPSCEQLFEYSAEQVLANPAILWELVHPDDIEMLKRSVQESNTTLKQWEVEWRIKLPSGKRKYVRGVGKPKRMEDGATLWNSFISDITKVKDQENILKRMQRLDTIGHLTGGITHDINNILNIISANCEIISVKNKNIDIQHNVERINKAIERATSLTTRLMLASRNNKISNNENRSIQTSIKNVEELIPSVCPKHIEIKWAYDVLADLKVIGDEFEDVLTNLLINSINASSADGVISVQVETGTTNDFDKFEYWQIEPVEADKYYILSVSDNGCGINPSDVEQVFTPFVTLNERTTGSGLGLSMVMGFASRNGFGISLNTEENKGTQIALWLPITDANDQSDNNVRARGDSPNASGKTIVLVDDEKEILATTEELLAMDGHSVKAFDNASEAKSWIADNIDSIDLVITDEVMPGQIQGHHLARDFSGKVPIIVISGFINTDDIAALEVPVYSKPVSLQVLRSAIYEHTR